MNSNIMNSHDHTFSNIVTVPHARAPIFKFTHVNTGLSCDVAFNDEIGLHHCNLFRFLLSLDGRLRPLFMIIKYWGFYHGITRSGHLPNFAFMIMIIFYFQQLKARILPPIKFLQDLVKGNRAIVNDWDCSFCDDVKRIPKNRNNLELQSLLYGFFDYYSKFDYKTYVICPFLGKPVEKSQFVPQDGLEFSEMLQDELNNYKEYCRMNPNGSRFTVNFSSLCVQDPFNLSFNVTNVTSEKYICRFFWLCGYSCEFIFKKKSVNIIKELFSPPAIDGLKNLILNEKFKRDINIHSLPLNENEVQEFDEEMTEDYKNDWFKYLKESILMIFEDVLKLDINLNSDTNPCSDDVKLLNHLSFDCKGVCPIYKDRRKIFRILHLKENCDIKNDICVSEYISNHYRDTWCYFNAHFSMMFYSDTESPRVSLSLIDTSVSKFNSFPDFSKFINTFIEELCKLSFKYIAVNGFHKLPLFESRLHLNSGPTQNDCSLNVQKSLSTEASSVSSCSTDTSLSKSARRRKKKNN